MSKRSLVLVWSVAGLLLCLGCCPTPKVKRTADLEAIAVLVQHRGAGSTIPTPVPIKTVAKFYEGDSLTADVTGRANLTITGCILEIYWGSKLTFKVASSSAPACAITLEQGTIVVNSTAGTEIDTPWATITSFGTQYLVYVNLEQQILWAIVWDGRLILDPLAEGLPSVEVTQDRQSWMWQGRAPVDPVPATRSEVPDMDLFPPLERLTAYQLDGEVQHDFTDAVSLPPGEVIQGSIALWHSWGEAEFAGLEGLIADFQNQHPDVGFDVQYIPANDLRAKFATAAAAGQGPTILLGPAEWGPALYDAQQVADLSTMAGRDLLTSLSPFALNAARYRGAVVGLPHRLQGVVMYRNRAILPEAPGTFDDLLAMAKEASAHDLLGIDLERGFFFSAAHLNGIGGQLMDDAGNPTFNNEKGVEWLRLLEAFSYTGPAEYNTDNDLEQFRRGGVGVIIDGTWNLALLRDAIGAENLAIDPWPAYGDGHLSGYVQAENLYLSAAAMPNDQQAAWKFMEFLLSPEAQARLTNVGHIPAVAGVGAGDPLLQQAIEVLKEGTPFPIIPEMEAYWEPMDAALTSVFEQKADPFEALQVAQESVTRAIEEIRARP
jgi:maltose-binding protein MalE